MEIRRCKGDGPDESIHIDNSDINEILANLGSGGRSIKLGLGELAKAISSQNIYTGLTRIAEAITGGFSKLARSNSEKVFEPIQCHGASLTSRPVTAFVSVVNKKLGLGGTVYSEVGRCPRLLYFDTTVGSAVLCYEGNLKEYKPANTSQRDECLACPYHDEL